ncbi:pseudaminic acid synthase [Helicobacter cholecystus]|uniref:Pseudaminic acid synthase n=1 Tax=Helicobacter cholecystus TaxID=45498 RepID=A0A3D8IWJ8_9HELI|nr:pseudaminic acid synthase [Helicobacter cholecystus]RDU69669.1 pseudaminic acid synthase [Helicobacter cholecystus]VEJ24233.1 sialic acid synthase [Helicobacter cholecystus]
MIPFIVAELSANHNQDLDIAFKSIKAAKDIGADAVKIQTYTPSCLTLNSNKEEFLIKGGLWDGENLYSLYSKACTPFEWHKELFSYAKKIGIVLFSTPFSQEGLELLESLSCPMYKVASFELTYLDLIKSIASTQKPIVLSSGIATDEEITQAIEVCRSVGNEDITLLKCTSSYPTPLHQSHLAAMKKFKKKWNVKVGLSDHTQGFLAPIIATSLGASMIEKHFILEKSLGGVDSAFSLDVVEFAEMIKYVRNASIALGDENYQNSIDDSKRKFSRSIFTSKDIKKGEIFTEKNLTIKRPNCGLHPKFYKDILGKKALRDLPFATPLQEGDFN